MKMGCDIHAGVILDDADYAGGGYYLRAQFSLSRDYRMFAALAGVRNSYNITPIAEPRGWKESWRYLDDLNADHSMSHCNVEELEEAVKRAKYKGWPAGVEYNAIIAYMKVQEKMGMSPIFVFGFDN